MQVVEELADRIVLADDLGIFPRRDINGLVLLEEPEVLYAELEDRILSFERSVFHPKAITVETEVQNVQEGTAGMKNEGIQEESDAGIVTEVMLDDESNYFWLYLVLILFSFLISLFVMLSRPFIHYLGNRRDGFGGGACYSVARWLWTLRLWLLKRAMYRFGNLGVVRKTHTKSAMRRYLRDYNFQLESWETAINCSPSEALIAADQHILVQAVQELLDLDGGLESVDRVRKVFKIYNVSNYKIFKWLDKQVTRSALILVNNPIKTDEITLEEGMLNLMCATYEQVLSCDVETQRNSMYFSDLIALQFAFRLVGSAEFSDFVVAYKGSLYPCYVEAIGKHASKLETQHLEDDDRKRNEKALEWLLMAGQGAFALSTAVSVGVFVFKIHKWIQTKLMLRSLEALPSVGGGGGGGGGAFPPEALNNFFSAGNMEERLAALHTGLDVAAVNMETFSPREFQIEMQQVVQAYADTTFHEADRPFLSGLGDVAVDGATNDSDTFSSSANVGTDVVSSLSLGTASKSRRRAISKNVRMYPGGSVARGGIKAPRVSGRSGVGGMKMKFTSKPMAT